jgi:hypothetical protein
VTVIHTNLVGPLPRQLCGRCPVRILSRTHRSVSVFVIFLVLSSSALIIARTIDHVALILSCSTNPITLCFMVPDATSVLDEMHINRPNGYVGAMRQCAEMLLLVQLAGVVIVCCRNMRDVTPCRFASSFCLNCSILKKKSV